VVQRYVLNKIKDDRLRVYVVWLPTRDGDNESAARNAMQYLVDSRVRHFWVNDLFLAEGFKKPLGLKEEVAWDVYLLFPKGATWRPRVPDPVLFMNLGRNEMPASSVLNGIKLADEIRKLLGNARK
jgi:hypothetical protein